MSLHSWCHQGPHKPSNCATFTLNSHQGRAATGKNSLMSMRAGSLWSSPTLYNPVDRLLCQGGGFSRQEYWSELANTGCHTLLEHYISCCPSCQLPWVPGATSTPVTQAAAPLPHLALIEANPRPPGKLQKQSPVDNPHAEVEIKPQLKPRGSVAKEEDPARAAASVGLFSRGTTRFSGSLSCGAREVRSPWAWQGRSEEHTSELQSP